MSFISTLCSFLFIFSSPLPCHICTTRMPLLTNLAKRVSSPAVFLLVSDVTALRLALQACLSGCLFDTAVGYFFFSLYLSSMVSLMLAKSHITIKTKRRICYIYVLFSVYSCVWFNVG